MATLTRHDAGSSRRTSRGAGSAALVLAGTWVLVLAAIVGFGWLITHPLQGSVNPWDNGISRWFAHHRSGVLDPVADAGTLLGETPIGVAVAAVAAGTYAAWRRTWRPVLFVLLLEAGIGGFYAIATHVVTRMRPPVKILDPGLVPDHSFPSGHVATAVVAYAGIFVLTSLYAHAARRWVGLVLLLPVFVLLARLYQGAHHLTDVLTSVVYATVWLLVVARLVLAPDPRRPSPEEKESSAGS